MNDLTKLTKAVKKLFEMASNFVTTTEIQSYARKNEIPNSDDFVTREKLASDLTKYAKKPEDVTIGDNELKQWLDEFIR